MNFGDQDISKCLDNLFVVVEELIGLVWLVLVLYSFTHVINCAVSVKRVAIR